MGALSEKEKENALNEVRILASIKYRIFMLNSLTIATPVLSRTWRPS
jgi:hypothetical protein